MPKIKYVGLKVDGETAFAAECGIARWMPGASRDVDAKVAERMLKHPDVFAIDEDGKPAPALAQVAPAATPAPTPTPTPAPTSAPVVVAPGTKVGDAPADPLAGLDDAGVRAFAKDKGLKIMGIALLKGENLRAKVRAALSGEPAPAAKAPAKKTAKK